MILKGRRWLWVYIRIVERLDLDVSVCGVDAVGASTDCNVEGCSMGLGCLTKVQIGCTVEGCESGSDDQGCSRVFHTPDLRPEMSQGV